MPGRHVLLGGEPTRGATGAMRHATRGRRALLAASMLALAGAGFVPAASAADAPPPAAGRYIVVLRDGADGAAAARRHGVAADAVFSTALDGYAGPLTSAQVRTAASDPDVLFLSHDDVVTTMAKPGGGQPAQSTPTGILRIGGAASRHDGVPDTTDVDVAVIDSGIDPAHPDLNVAGGVSCTSGRTWDDGNGHGTHVAGTIGARDNDIGVVGVAPGARLWAVRVLNNAGVGSDASVLCGIDWVTANASTIEVANMSLGGPGSDDGDCGNTNGDAVHRAICASVAAGVTYVVAAGNEAGDAATFTPAAYDEVITVSAWADFDGQPGGLAAPTCRTDEDDSFASFSNFGPDVDIAAPGVCILSTWKRGAYNTISGTSMATPHVTGAAALVMADHPKYDPDDVRAALLGHSDSTAPPDDPDGVWEGLLSVEGWL